MRLYKDPFQYGGWYLLIQIPIYLLLWDLVFYILHRWVLHTKLGYLYSHINHHAFRPPTGWSGIAIDPFEVLMSGILPYLIPLFVGIPFNEYLVYIVNALLIFHALTLHSACHARYPGYIGWVLLSPIDHNMHHTYGENAKNFGAITKIYDRIFGTLVEDKEPFWWKSDVEYKKKNIPRTIGSMYGFSSSPTNSPKLNKSKSK